MPARKDPRKAFTSSFRKRRTVSAPIASEVWTFADAKGRKRMARLAVGRPERIPGDRNADWFCPVHIGGWTPHVVPAIGVGPLDALRNALTLVRAFHEQIGEMHIRRDQGAGSRKR